MNPRYRILRKTKSSREMVAETRMQVEQLILPIFLEEGNDVTEISSMPGISRFGIDKIYKEMEILLTLGLRSFLLFTKVEDEKKDPDCSEALNEDGLMARCIKGIKSRFPETNLFTDVALDPFSPDGHDGLVKNGEIINDETIDILAKMSVLHAQCGADFVAPSDMMDGRIAAIRKALESNGLKNTGIMSYSAKYASCFYGPFRDALDSAPGFGDKKTYQMDYRNRLEAVKETLQDIREGADIVMVKPAGSYLDIIREVKNAVSIPVAAYQVSGEYSMIKASAKMGWLNEEQAFLETIHSIKRAGADLIATYYAKEFSKLLK